MNITSTGYKMLYVLPMNVTSTGYECQFLNKDSVTGGGGELCSKFWISKEDQTRILSTS